MQNDLPYAAFKAAGLILFCMMVVSFSDNLLPFISNRFGLWELHATRSLMACTILLCAGYILQINFRPKNISAVALRSFCFSLGMVLYFAALGAISVAQAGAGLFTSPLFVLLFSVIFFRKQVSLIRILTVLFGFIGVLLVLKPSNADFSWLSILPVLGGAAYALGLLATRHMCADESTLVLVFWFFMMLGLIGMIGASYMEWLNPETQQGLKTYLNRGWTPPTTSFLLLAGLMAFITLIAVTAQARAYQIAETSYLAVFEYSFLVFAAIWGWLLWQDKLDMIAIFGMLAIVISGTVIAVQDRTHPA